MLNQKTLNQMKENKLQAEVLLRKDGATINQVSLAFIKSSNDVPVLVKAYEDLIDELTERRLILYTKKQCSKHEEARFQLDCVDCNHMPSTLRLIGD